MIDLCCPPSTRVISLAQDLYLYLVNYLVLSPSEFFSPQPSSHISVYLILAIFLCIRFVEKIDNIRNTFIFLYNFIMPYNSYLLPFVVVFYFKGNRISFQRPTLFLCIKYQISDQSTELHH